MLTAYEFQQQNEITMGSLLVCCNGKLALDWASSSSPIGATEPHSDLNYGNPEFAQTNKMEIKFSARVRTPKPGIPHSSTDTRSHA